MAIKLNREGIALNAEERNKRNENLTLIEKAIADVEEGSAGTLEKVTASEVTATEAKTIATEANQTSESVQTQLDVLVLEGDSSVEAAQARVGVDGTSYSTLKTRIDAEQTKTNQQLAETLKQGEVAVSDINKNLGLLDQTYMTTEFIQQMAGNAPVNATPADDTLTLKKTTFYKTGKNLFNKSAVTLNSYVKETDGILASTSLYHASEFIKVKPSTTYTKTNDLRMAFYDANKNFISGLPTGLPMTFTTPSNAVFVRLTVRTDGSLNITQLEAGTVSTPFEAYKIFIDKNFVEAQDVDASKIADNTLDFKKTSFVTLGKNLFNVNQVERGMAVHQGNGTIYSAAAYFASPFIEVSAGSSYRLSKEENGARVGWSFSFYAWYDKNKAYISGGQSTSTTDTLTPPTNAIFLRFTGLVARISENYQLEKGAEYTEFEPYRLKFIYDTEIPSNPMESAVYELVLPAKIPMVVGRETNIYYDNILKNGNAYKAERFNVSGGTGYEDHTTYIPVAGSTTSTIKADLYTNGKIIKTASSQLVPVLLANGTGTTKNVLAIGDSLSDNPIVIPELANLFATDAMKINLLGTRGTAPNKHEARAGWSAYNYTTNSEFKGVSNPFYNPATSAFDFSYYMQNQGYSSVDIVPIYLMTNDLSEVYPHNQTENIISNLKKIIASIKSYNVNIKILIGMPPMSSRWFVGWGEDYKNKALSLNERLIVEFDKREAEQLYLEPVYLNVDPYWDFEYIEKPISARNPKTQYVGKDVIHPSVYGYHKLADMHFNMIKYVSG